MHRPCRPRAPPSRFQAALKPLIRLAYRSMHAAGMDDEWVSIAALWDFRSLQAGKICRARRYDAGGDGDLYAGFIANRIDP